MPNNEEQNPGASPDDGQNGPLPGSDIRSGQPISGIVANPIIVAVCNDTYSLKVHVEDIYLSIKSWVLHYHSTSDVSSDNNVAAFTSKESKVVTPVSNAQEHQFSLTAPADEGHHVATLIGYDKDKAPVLSTSFPVKTTSNSAKL